MAYAYPPARQARGASAPGDVVEELAQMFDRLAARGTPIDMIELVDELERRSAETRTPVAALD